MGHTSWWSNDILEQEVTPKMPGELEKLESKTKETFKEKPLWIQHAKPDMRRIKYDMSHGDKIQGLQPT